MATAWRQTRLPPAHLATTPSVITRLAAIPSPTHRLKSPWLTRQRQLPRKESARTMISPIRRFKAWVAHLRELPQQAPQWRRLGMNSELINHLSEELITAATRLDLEGTLKRALAGQEQAGTRREHLMARQVLRAQLTMRDFIAWFGYLTLPPEKVPNSYVGEKNKSLPAPETADERR